MSKSDVCIVYLVEDCGIKKLHKVTDEEKESIQGYYDGAIAFDFETKMWWPADYIEFTAQAAVDKFMAYEKVKDLEAELIKELGPTEVRRLVRESEDAGAIANPKIAIEMFTRKLNAIACS